MNGYNSGNGDNSSGLNVIFKVTQPFNRQTNGRTALVGEKVSVVFFPSHQAFIITQSEANGYNAGYIRCIKD